LTGSAFTLVSPEEEGSVRDIERAIGKRLPRVTMPDFDYNAHPPARPEPARTYRDPRRAQNQPRKTWRRSR
jgi:superfamily II DNA/RNA helicase